MFVWRCFVPILFDDIHERICEQLGLFYTLGKFLYNRDELSPVVELPIGDHVNGSPFNHSSQDSFNNTNKKNIYIIFYVTKTGLHYSNHRFFNIVHGACFDLPREHSINLSCGRRLNHFAHVHFRQIFFLIIRRCPRVNCSKSRLT